MNAMTPFIDNPTGRLTELVYLLTDRPLCLSLNAVEDAIENLGGTDPLLVVAAAICDLDAVDETISGSSPRNPAADGRPPAVSDAPHAFEPSVSFA